MYTEICVVLSGGPEVCAEVTGSIQYFEEYLVSRRNSAEELSHQLISSTAFPTKCFPASLWSCFPIPNCEVDMLTQFHSPLFTVM